MRIGTRPEKFMGDPKQWDKAEKALVEIAKATGRGFEVLDGDGAFYGPKIDILMKDSLGRDWQTGTIQLDFQLPQRFNLKYTAADGSEKTPVVVHRVIYGSLERFLGILVEHTSGKLPLWISPVQAMILPISEKHLEYAAEVSRQLKEAGVRAEINADNNSIGKKIREAEMQKVPYMLIVGDKEKDSGTVAVRHRTKDDIGPVKVPKFIKMISDEINQRIG
jgi:threonyl-tRNA synthetase